MGHRREVFKPRTGRKRIESKFLQNFETGNFEGATQVALSHYIRKDSIDTIDISFIAIYEAVSLANELNWRREIEQIAHMAISLAEEKANFELTPFRKKTVVELVSKYLQKEKEGSSLVY